MIGRQQTLLLMRLQKKSLIELVFSWLDNPAECLPHRRPEGDDLGNLGHREYINDVRRSYESLKNEIISKRAVVERIIYVDWYRGLNLKQIADAEIQGIYDRPLSMKWTASEVRIYDATNKNLHKLKENLTRFHAPSFMKALQKKLKPLIDNDIQISQHPEMPLVILRIQLFESESSRSSTNRHLPSSRRVVFCAIPSSFDHIFHTTFLNPYQKLMKEVIEATLSKPGFQIKLESSSLSSRSLETLVHLRSTSRYSTAPAGWSIYAKNEVDESPIMSADEVIGRKLKKIDPNTDNASSDRKRRKVINARFGVLDPDESGNNDISESSQPALGPETALQRAEFLLEDEYRDHTQVASFTPCIRILLEGSHVFEGLRQLAQSGNIDHENMPAWVTGEYAISHGTIREGKLVK
ncbi:centromere protein Chl4/mis15/CENP-N [Dipodascopsis uninucleata]